MKFLCLGRRRCPNKKPFQPTDWHSNHANFQIINSVVFCERVVVHFWLILKIYVSHFYWHSVCHSARTVSTVMADALTSTVEYENESQSVLSFVHRNGIKIEKSVTKHLTWHPGTTDFKQTTLVNHIQSLYNNKQTTASTKWTNGESERRARGNESKVKKEKQRRGETLPIVLHENKSTFNNSDRQRQ